MLKMEELEVDSETERPIYPPKILSISIINNPFDDILPRITSEEKKASELAAKLKNETKKPKKKEKKRLNLLSFGAEEEEHEKDLEASKINTKIKSSHDLLTEDTHLSNKVSVDLEKEKIVKKDENINGRNRSTEKESDNTKKENNEGDKEYKTIDEIKSEKMKNIQNEINKIKKEFMVKDKKKSSKENNKDNKKKKRGLELLQMEREKYLNSSKAISKKSKKHKSSHDEDETLKLMLNFKKQLQDITYSENSSSKRKKEHIVEIDEHGLCKLHNKKNCLSCQAEFNERNQKELLGEISDDDNDNNTDDENWLSHNLVFEDKGSKDIFKVDDYIVIDPREREKQAKKEYYSKKNDNKIAKSFKSSHRSHHHRH